MFRHNARSQTTQNLSKLFSRELSDRRNVYLCLVGFALVIGGAGGVAIANWVNPGKVTIESNPNIASASMITDSGAFNSLPPSRNSSFSKIPTDREQLISKVWQCQLSWIDRVNSPETLSTDDLNKLLEQCKAARSGGDS
jgi:hypothetical protein